MTIAKILILLFSIIYNLPTIAQTEIFNGSVPRLIYKHMRENGCEPIENFYEDYTVDQPPFLQLHAVAEIFVCQFVSEDDETKYKLVFRISDFEYHSGEYHEWHEFKSCPSVIISDRKFGGLTIDRSKHEINGSMKDFLTLTIGKDGGFATYICNNSEWINEYYH